MELKIKLFYFRFSGVLENIFGKKSQFSSKIESLIKHLNF